MRTHGMKSLRDLSIALAVFLTITGCGYNKLQGLDEEVKGAWGEVQNQYQRRADLVPNLVSTVKGAANFEQETPRGSSKHAAPPPRSKSTPTH